jgi:polyisoprenoid-binding protein YceI
MIRFEAASQNKMRTIMQIGLAVWLALGARMAGAQTTYRFDASKSSLEIRVSKAVLFSTFGHDHVVKASDFSGTVNMDAEHLANASVSMRVPVKSLTVVDPGVSASGRQQVQATMQGDAVLGAARYPEISFRSTQVEHAEPEGNGWRVTLTGVLQLHGTQKPISFPAVVHVARGELTAQGDASLLQSDYGIKPIKIAGGAVKVKDRVRIHFEIHAYAKPSS